MDADDFEDMLFGSAVSQDALQDFPSDASDDELLFAPIEDKPLGWDPQDGPMLMPATIDTQTYTRIYVDDTEPSLTPRETGVTKLARAPPRDRHCPNLPSSLYATDFSSDIGFWLELKLYWRRSWTDS